MRKKTSVTLPRFSLVNVLESSKFFKKIVRLLLLFLTAVILIALFGGIVRTLLDLRFLFSQSLVEAMRKIIVDVVIVLAVVEIYKTTYTYFSEGRVRVTYIVDTVLVVMLAEVISTWFSHPAAREMAVLIGVLFALILIRILAIRFHPKDERD